MHLIYLVTILVILSACQQVQKADSSLLAPAPKNRSASAFRDSIYYSPHMIDPLVKNGDCYERFQLSLPPEIKTVVLPKGSTTFKGSEMKIEGYVRKSLLWAGHPGESGMSIDSERILMGVAIARESHRLRIVGFGAWHSFEGGSSVMLAVSIPDGVQVRYSDSPADNTTATKLTTQGWLVIETEPASMADFTSRYSTE